MLIDAKEYASAMGDLFGDDAPEDHPSWRVRPLAMERYERAAARPRPHYDAARAEKALRWVKEHLFIEGREAECGPPREFFFLGTARRSYPSPTQDESLMNPRPDRRHMERVSDYEPWRIDSYLQAVDRKEIEHLLQWPDPDRQQQAYVRMVEGMTALMGNDLMDRPRLFHLAESLIHHEALERMVESLSRDGMVERIARHANVKSATSFTPPWNMSRSD